jgi:hypothetical protein
MPPAPTRTRKRRGASTQSLVAEWYDHRLWPGATSAGAGEAGQDIKGVPFDIEVKARRSFDPVSWIRQVRERTKKNGGRHTPGFVVMRPDGLGDKSVAEFLVIRRLDDDTDILAELLELRRRVEELDLELDRAAYDVAELVRARDELRELRNAES